MIAKLIVYGKDRAEALTRARRALDEFLIDGVKTTIPFTKFILTSTDFIDGNYDTGYIERIMKRGIFTEE
jgi:acetyl-CoA carboxylase biotin carboxylase subunit